jgi:predicted nucleic acid-binding protein
MISFDTNILVYATASVPDVKALRARDLIGRAMRAGWTILLLQTLAEFANVAIRKAGIPIEDIRRTIDAWRAVLPIQAADDDDLAAALEAVRAHRLSFWDAMLWASAQRAGVRCLLTEDYGVSHSGSWDYCVFRAIALSNLPRLYFGGFRQCLHWLGQNL